MEELKSNKFKQGEILGVMFIVFIILVFFALPWSIGITTIFKYFTGM